MAHPYDPEFIGFLSHQASSEILPRVRARLAQPTITSREPAVA